MARIRSFRETGERYGALRVVGVTCIGLGAIALAVGSLFLAFGIAAMTAGPVRPVDGVGGVIFLIWSLGFFAAGLQSLAAGALIRLAIHVEENTRATAQALDKIRANFEPKALVGDEDRPMFLS